MLVTRVNIRARFFQYRYSPSYEQFWRMEWACLSLRGTSLQENGLGLLIRVSPAPMSKITSGYSTTNVLKYLVFRFNPPVPLGTKSFHIMYTRTLMVVWVKAFHTLRSQMIYMRVSLYLLERWLFQIYGNMSKKALHTIYSHLSFAGQWCEMNAISRSRTSSILIDFYV